MTDYNASNPIIESNGTPSQVFRNWMLRVERNAVPGGSVAHADTTGQTPDDHHDRLHDHSDALDGFVAFSSIITTPTTLAGYGITDAISLAELAATVSPTGASLVGMESVAGATYATLEDMQNVFHSAGWVSGGAITDAGGATIDIAAGVGLLRSSNSVVAQLINADWAAVAGVATTVNAINYIIIEWNAGAPQVLTPLPVSDTSNGNTSWLLGVVVNEAASLHIVNHRITVGDHAAKMIERTHAVEHISRDNQIGGLIIASTGTNDITMTAGSLWIGLQTNAVAVIDTAAAGVFDSYYDNGSGFTKVGSGIGAWDALQYENAGTLTILGNNKYANLWWYVSVDGAMVMLYGNAQYNTAAAAELESPPASVPQRVQEHGILLGRFIFKKSAAIAAEVQTVFTTTFSNAGVTAHGDLTGIGTNTHTQIDAVLPLTGTGSPEGVLTAVVGKLYTDSNGGASTTLYVKESGTGNTGWVAK